MGWFTAFMMIASMLMQSIAAKAARKRQRRLEQEAKQRADAAKGFQIAAEGEASLLPILYGRGMLGGVRVFHNTSSNYVNAAPLASSTLFHNSMDASRTGVKHEFLTVQVALCFGDINSCQSVMIDGRSYDDAKFKSAIGSADYLDSGRVMGGHRFHFNPVGGVADPLMTANYDTRPFTNTAYATCVYALNRDEYQYSGVPDAKFICEGLLVYTIIGTQGNRRLSQYRSYSNNPALCLLDYLTNRVYGRGLELQYIDLDSFAYAASICDIVVLPSVPLEGTFWTAKGGTRSIKLYECNLTLSPATSIRSNVETILETMGQAELIWSAGTYKLSLEYPSIYANNFTYPIGHVLQYSANGFTDIYKAVTSTTSPALPAGDLAYLTNVTNWSTNVIAAYLTDDDILRSSENSVAWPNASERYNFCTVRFLNEAKEFVEDSVSWPFRLGTIPGASVDRGIWSVTGVYGRSDITTYNSVKYQCIGNVLYSGIWDATITYVNTERVLYLSNHYIAINNPIAGTLPTNTGFWTLLSNPTTTINPSVDPAWMVYNDTLIYNTYRAEDHGLPLEADFFESGITDYYHALSKAEQRVRFSRSSTVYKFSIITKHTNLEPGDLIKVTSEVMSIFGVVMRIEEIKLNSKGNAEITASQFDAKTLSWNHNSAEVITPPLALDSNIDQCTNLSFTTANLTNGLSSGRFAWTPPNDIRVKYFNVKYTTDVTVTSTTIWGDLGQVTSAFMELPSMTTDTYKLTVVAETIDGKIAPRNNGLGSSWPVLAVGTISSVGVEKFVPVTVYTRSATVPLAPTGGVFSFTSLTLTTLPTGAETWTLIPPTGTYPLYASSTVASTNSVDIPDSTLTWSTPATSSDLTIDVACTRTTLGVGLDFDGNNAIYSEANGAITIKVGGVSYEGTSEATYALSGVTNCVVTPLTTANDSNKGKFFVTSLTGVQGRFTITATFRGINYPFIITPIALKGVYIKDLTVPPAPNQVTTSPVGQGGLGLTVTAGYSTMLVTLTASPIYTVGHGHSAIVVYAATGASSTFANAVEIARFTGTQYSLPAELNNGDKRLWFKNITVDGVLSTNYCGATGAQSNTALVNGFVASTSLINANILTGTLAGSLIPENIIDATKIAKSIDPVAIVNELPSGLFKRQSVGTYIDADSLVKYAVPNEPRYNYDPLTGVLSGLLIEAAAKNNIFKSADILNTNGWAYGATLANFFTATFSNEIKQPDGTSDKVAKFVAAAAPAVLFLRQVGVNGVVGAHTTSIYIYVPTQAGVTSWGFQSDWADVDASNTVSSTVFNKWIRVSVLATLTATRGFLDFNITRNGTTPTTGFTFYAAMPQDELGTTMTSYIPSVRTFISRALTSTNLALYSEDFTNAAWSKLNCTITANGATAPDGTVTADTVVRTAASNHYLIQTYTVASPANRTFTFSVYIAFGTLTGNMNIYFKDGAGTIPATGTLVTTNGAWNRYSVTSTFGAGAAANIQLVIDPANDVGIAGDTFWVWGAQLEETNVASAYISTTSTAVSRNNASTYYDKLGNVVKEPLSVIRKTYTPSNLDIQPYDMIETRATNLVTASEYFGNSEESGFIYNKASAGVYYDGTLSPDGVNLCQRLEEFNVTDYHYISKSIFLSESKTYTFSCYAKMETSRYVWLEAQVRSGSYSNTATFDLLTGTVTYRASITTAVIEKCANGWYRVSITYSSSTGATTLCAHYAGINLNNGINTTYMGARGNYLYLWGLQVEEGVYATSYIPTLVSYVSNSQIATYVNSSGLIATAPANTPRMTYLPMNLTAPPTLLLEAAADNMCFYSEQFDNAYWGKLNVTVTANVATAPDGLVSADKISDTAIAGLHEIYSTNMTVTSASICFSIFVKAAGITQIQLVAYEATTPSNPVNAYFDLTAKTATPQAASTVIASIDEYPNGWFRCRVSSISAPLVSTNFQIFLMKTGSTTYTGDGTSGVYLWGANVVMKRALSSYIASTTGAASRAADVISGAATTRSADAITDTYGTRAADIAGYTTPRILFNSSDAKMYRIDYAVPTWIATTSARDITDLIEANQIVANSLTAGQIAAGAIGVTELAAGAVSADKLAVGNGKNLLPISTWAHQTTVGASVAWNTTTLVPVFNWRALDAYTFGETLQLVYTLTPAATTVTDVVLHEAAYIPIIAGKKYEASAYINTHRCSAQIKILWLTSTGTQISEIGGNWITNLGAGGDQLSQYGRSTLIAQAPATATRAYVYIRTIYDGQTNPYTFFLRTMFAEATANQTEASAWAPAGLTTINGGVIKTASIVADKLNVTSLSSVSANLGTVTAGNITLDSAGFIQGGQTAYATGNGFYLGYSGVSYKMSVGNATNGFTWDGAIFTLKGDLVAGSININNKFIVDAAGNVTLKSAATGARLELVNDVIRVYDAAGTLRVKLGNLI